MQSMAAELPEYKVMFLSPLSKDAFLRFSTWLVCLFNYLDEHYSEEGLIYFVP